MTLDATEERVAGAPVCVQSVLGLLAGVLRVCLVSCPGGDYYRRTKLASRGQVRYKTGNKMLNFHKLP